MKIGFSNQTCTPQMEEDNMNAAQAGSVKVDIISGFLGAGKTTFINKLLADGLACEQLALIENELGDIAIDGELIESRDGLEVRTMASGCICCSLNSDFASAIVDIVETYHPTRIIVEPTGIAEPSEIARICEREVWQVDLAVNSIITIVNGANLTEMLDLEIGVFEQQLKEASFILLNRVSSLEEDELEQAKRAIKRLAPAAVCHVCDTLAETDSLALLALAEEAWAQRPAALGINVSFGVPAAPAQHHHHHHEHAEVEAVSTLPSENFAPESHVTITSMLEAAQHGVVLRAKGFLSDGHGGFSLYEYVYGQGSLTPCAYDGSPKLVIIGKGVELSDFAALGA